jgi:hypothetical protein
MSEHDAGSPAAEVAPQSPPGPIRPRTTSRRLWVGGALGLVPALAYGWSLATYPSDRTPEGAYLRVVSAVNRGQPEEFFAYTEEAAQHACYTIRDYRSKARALIESSYPEPERAQWLARYRELASAPDGSDVFAHLAKERGWLNRLRRDMSGIQRVEVSGERASVETARGTRYPFRRRPNGIWGTTLFTAELTLEAEKAARDLKLIEVAAADYRRAAHRSR